MTTLQIVQNRTTQSWQKSSVIITGKITLLSLLYLFLCSNSQPICGSANPLTYTRVHNAHAKTQLCEIVCAPAQPEIACRCDTPAEKPIPLCCPRWSCPGPGEQSHRLRWLNLFIWMSFFVPLLQQHSPEADPRYVFCLFFNVVIEILWTNTGSRSAFPPIKKEKKKSFCEYGSRFPFLGTSKPMPHLQHTHVHNKNNAHMRAPAELTFLFICRF